MPLEENQYKIEFQLTLSGDRFHTITLCPELRRFLTTPDPMIPSPKNPKVRVDG